MNKLVKNTFQSIKCKIIEDSDFLSNMQLWDIRIVLFSTIISLCNKNGNPNYDAVNGFFWSHYTQLYFWSITMISRLLEIVKMSLNQNVKFDLVSQWNTLTSMSQDVIDNKCKIETVPEFKIKSVPFSFRCGDLMLWVD